MENKIYGRVFFNYLIENDNKSPYLLKENIAFYKDKLIVCLISNGTNYFTYFDNYIDFYKFNLKLPIEKRSFFEIIIGNFAQKPHFDIDIKISDIKTSDINSFVDILLSDLLNSICLVLKDMGVDVEKDRDILIYDSNGKEKRSYHILINNYCHSNNLEAKEFYKRVITGMKDKKNSKYIDNMVYSKKQQFRILGSQKLGSGRVKKLNSIFKIDDIVYEHKYDEVLEDFQKSIVNLSESLVSFTKDCKILPHLIKTEKEYNIKHEDITDDTVELAFKYMKEKFEEVVFGIYRVEPGMIMLWRYKPSYCYVCKRNHDNQHPYIFIRDNTLYFNCRRNSNHFLLGKITNENKEIEDEISYMKEMKEFRKKEHNAYENYFSITSLEIEDLSDVSSISSVGSDYLPIF
jgi:hypothetical protein